MNASAFSSCSSHRLARTVATCVLAAMLAACGAARADEVTTLNTPQVRSALRPLEGVPDVGTGGALVHAVVATMPDPLETRQGRSFDMALAAGIAGFQAHGYVLDGFELQWPPDTKDADGASRAAGKLYRDTPGLLVFRRDNWRAGTRTGAARVEYFVLFLVGESPTYGIQPEAFRVAAQCAIRLDGATRIPTYLDPRTGRRDLRCDRMPMPAPPRGGAPKRQLSIVGPSFSGSMQSVLVAMRSLCAAPGECVGLRILMLSPSATANSNAMVQQQPIAALARGRDGRSVIAPAIRPVYLPLAIGMDQQFRTLQDFLCKRSGPVAVAVLAEESTYGNEMLAVARRAKQQGCVKKLSTAQFPPNIASIRTEQARLSRPQKDQLRSLVPGASRLLEFNLDTADEGADRPPPYQPEVSSRSDELMLYRMFDAMRLYVEPDVVIIVATEIRDRLFVLSQVRNQLPAALPVLFELDYLTVHPDYRKTSRGAIVVPASDARVCMDKARLRLISCEKESPEGAPRIEKQYHAFPSDYAANAFRAVSILAELPVRPADGPPGIVESFVRDAVEIRNNGPRIFVATLAGMQGVDDRERGRNALVAAETRMIAQIPAYIALVALSVFAFISAMWILPDPRGGKWVLSFARRLLYDARAIPHRTRAPFVATSTDDAADSLVPSGNLVWIGLMLVFASAALALSSARLIQLFGWLQPAGCGVRCNNFLMAHGRDGVAMACLWLLYGCIAIVGLVRVQLLDRRFHLYVRHLSPRHMRAQFVFWSGSRNAWMFPALLFAGVVFVQWLTNPFATSVDPAWPWTFAAAVLTLGVVFLVHLVRQHRLQRRLSMFLAAAIPIVRTMRDTKDWPSYTATGDPPTTPFNLKLRRVLDLGPLTCLTPREWMRQTRSILDAGPNDRFRSEYDFLQWQSRLVAELKLVASTIRTTAWCAMLAPVAVLLATTVYVPIYEGFLTAVCILMLIAGFATTVYIVLRMEADPMLGPMFTRDGDHLTFGGGLRALWPKFVAMGLVLLPLVAPDMWRWLHGLLRSVNSIQ